MTTQPDPSASGTIPIIVEDLFLTSNFLIKGRIANKYSRLTKMLEDNERMFLHVEDATMVSLRGQEVIKTPSVMVNRAEVIFAHELVDVAGDNMARGMAQNEKPVRVRAFHSGQLQIEMMGMVAPGAYESQHNAGRWYFIMLEPVVRGLNLDANAELGVLKGLDYAIVRKDKMSYIYDFS